MIVVDASPLQTGHRYRGIGSYTASLLDALTLLPHPLPLGLLAEAPRLGDLPLLADLLKRPGVSPVHLYRPQWNRSRLQWLLGLLTVGPSLSLARPRLYHATEPNGLVRLPGVVTVATLYDLIPLRRVDTAFCWRRLDHRVGYARYLRQLQRVDHIIAISEATKRDAMERLRIPPDRMTVTPLAVDERRFYPRSPREIDDTLARYGLRRPYFFHVGSSDPSKNTATIVRAFDLFCRDRHPAHALYIAGKWPAQDLAALDAAYPQLVVNGRLRMLGFVPDEDLPAIYSGADALVYPSLMEGFGLPVLEAMRCGTPVLTSSVSSLPEVADDAALLIDPRDAEAIAHGLRQLAEEPALRADLVARGLRRAQQFSWTRTAQQTLRVYAELM